MNLKKQKPELSTAEKDRRWFLVRQKMKKEGLAAIVVYGDRKWSVPIRYLTNIYTIGKTQEVLIFPVEGAPVLYLSQPSPILHTEGDSFLPPEDMHFSSDWASAVAKHLIKMDLHKERMGIDSYKSWPAREYKIFRGLCPDAELVEAATFLSKIRGPKSGEEIKLIKEAVRVGEIAQRTFLANLKPGLREEEIVGKVEEAVRKNGVEERLFLISSNPSRFFDLPGDIIIDSANPVTFSSEFARTKGYGCQVVRTYCWEEPKDEYKRAWALWGQLRNIALEELRPGREITAVGARIEKISNEWGFNCDYMGHAVGLYFSDDPYISSRPSMQRYMQWTIMPNEVYVFHPQISSKDGRLLAWSGDMYLVGEDSTECLTPFLQGLPEVIA